MARHISTTEEPVPLDRRVARTKKALREALLALVQEKGYDAVSVEEIARRADLGRATFYLHYRDKDDLLLDEFVELAKERVRAVSEIPLTDWIASAQGKGGEAPLPLLQIFQHAAENADLYRVLVHRASATGFAERVRVIITDSMKAFLQAKVKSDALQIQPRVPLDLLGAYFSGALHTSLAWWLEQEHPPEPAKMARMFQEMFLPGARRALGL